MLFHACFFFFFLQTCIAKHESNGIDIIIALIVNPINPLGKDRLDLVLELKVSSRSLEICPRHPFMCFLKVFRVDEIRLGSDLLPVLQDSNIVVQPDMQNSMAGQIQSWGVGFKPGFVAYQANYFHQSK